MVRYVVIFVILGSLLSACEVDQSSSSVDREVYLKKGIEEAEPMNELKRWSYFTGSEDEGLNAVIPVWPDTSKKVNLPHRLLLPNTPMWYQCRILPRDSLVLRVSADDGAQVYFEGERVLSFHPRHFRLWPVQDSALLIIRVLNNAMSGGLRKATLFESAFFDTIQVTNSARLLALKERRYPDSMEILAGPFLTLSQDSMCQLRIQISSKESVSLHYSINGIRWDSTAAQRKNEHQIHVFDLPFKSKGVPVNYFFRQGQLESPQFRMDFDQQQQPVRFSAWGDSQGGWEVFSGLVDDMGRRNLEFTIGLGDLVANGSDPEQWLKWHQSLQPLASRIPVYPVPGNHDYDGYYDSLIPELYHQFTQDSNYFSWTWGPAMFIALDPNEDFPIGIRGQQLAWLDEQFKSERWQSSRWRFILLHQPPYSQSWKGYHGDDFIREIIDQQAEDQAIDFVLSGHSHAFEMKSKQYGAQATHFIILGGGGGGLEDGRFSAFPQMDTIIIKHHYGLFELDEQSVIFSLIDEDGNPIINETFKK